MSIRSEKPYKKENLISELSFNQEILKFEDVLIDVVKKNSP